MDVTNEMRKGDERWLMALVDGKMADDAGEMHLWSETPWTKRRFPRSTHVASFDKQKYTLNGRKTFSALI